MWDLLILNPMINALMLLYSVLGQNFVLSIVVFTLIVRLITLPLTFRQQQSTKAMQALQPKMKELQKKYKNDREGLLQAQQKLYSEHGINPLGGCLPTLIQFPILIGLYQAIINTLASAPNQLLDLSHRVYTFAPFSQLTSLVPLQNQFLGLNLGQTPAAPISFMIAALVFGSTFLQQKLMMPAQTGDSSDSTAQMTNTMQIMTPLMFGYFALNFAVGLSIYFIVSNLIGILQYWLIGRDLGKVAPIPVSAGKPVAEISAPEPNGRQDKMPDRAGRPGGKPSGKAGKPRASKAKRS